MQRTNLLKRLEVSDTQIPVIIPKKVYDQIRYLCQRISDVEWSGPLFYEIEGSIKDIKNFKITLHSIFPMDKGTSGYTEYDTNEDYVNAWMNTGFKKVGHRMLCH